MRTEIEKIISEEFTEKIKKIEKDFKTNYAKKANNFLLCQMDNQTKANMVFVSSFESKSGKAIENCARRIARLRYGVNNVPNIVNPRNIPCSFKVSKENEQIMVSDINPENGDLQGEITAFRANRVRKKKSISSVNQANIKDELLPLSRKYASSSGVFTKPVDLAFYDGQNWNIFELKAGGDLDTSNAPKNVEKLLMLYVDMGIENCQIYFGTMYNKDGEGNPWKGLVTKHMAYPEMFLIGKDFWNRILPQDISFEEFVEIYKSTLEKIKLNERVKAMIDNCIGS